MLEIIEQELNSSRGRSEPLYEQLANAIAATIRSGQVAPGAKLPPHREIASRLNVNIATVTRAMAMLQDENLIDTRPGRGTRVSAHRTPETQFQSCPRNEAGMIDLSVNRPATDAYNHVLAAMLPELALDTRFDSMKDYHASEGPVWAREAAALWLRNQGLSAHASQIIICDGAQHGLALALRAIAEPGECILTDSITYQGINALCTSLGLTLIGVKADARGMCPKALRQACLEHTPRAVFLVGSIQNPTAITLDETRRLELIDVIEHAKTLLLEDDVYHPLLDKPHTPMARHLPEQTIYISSLSKCIAPGLRFGFVLAPPCLVADISSSLRVDCWSVAPLSALVATRLIETGKARDLVVVQREELRARQTLLKHHMKGLTFNTCATSPHVWLTLPQHLNEEDFTRTCIEHGVAVLPGSAFRLNDEPGPAAVRINLSAAPTREQLARALDVIARLALQDASATP